MDVTRMINASQEQVWDVLADGWLYPLWVVGATRMREVDEGWPEVGSCLHHSAGVWPLVVDDTTEVLDVEPGTLLRLKARGWPAGEAEVQITLAAHGDTTEVVLHEDATSGPGRWVPHPVRQVALKLRNEEALQRLAALAEGR